MIPPRDFGKSSLTLGIILKHWKGPLPFGGYSFPFDLEAVCREMDEIVRRRDELLDEVTKKLEFSYET